MDRPGNPLLSRGAGVAWARIDAAQRDALARSRDTVEQRLLRGQRLSAQAALLRRSVRNDAPADSRP